jgi:hypothetical protein
MNRVMRMLGAGVAALSMFVTFPTYSGAALFGVDVDAEFGLDQKTMEFINGLAPQVREEVIKLLKEALPLIDGSVTAYLDKVDGILEKQISHMQCAAIGAGAALSDDLKGKVFGGAPQPLSKLEEDMKKTISGFKPDVKPHDMRLAYSDLIYRATVTNCQVALAPETAKDVSAILENVRPRWMVWYRLDGSCTSIKECFNLEAAHAKKTLGDADVRDVVSANGHARLAAVKQPTTKAVGMFSKTFDPTDYEKALGELISIEDGVKLAAAKRRADARKSIDTAKAVLEKARQNMNSSPKGPFDRRNSAYRYAPNCDQPKRALVISYSVMSDLAAVSQSLVMATALDNSLQSVLDQVTTEATTIRQEAETQMSYAKSAEYYLRAGNFNARLPCQL